MADKATRPLRRQRPVPTGNTLQTLTCEYSSYGTPPTAERFESIPETRFPLSELPLSLCLKRFVAGVVRHKARNRMGDN